MNNIQNLVSINASFDFEATSIEIPKNLLNLSNVICEMDNDKAMFNRLNAQPNIELTITLEKKYFHDLNYNYLNQLIVDDEIIFIEFIYNNFNYKLSNVKLISFDIFNDYSEIDGKKIENILEHKISNINNGIMFNITNEIIPIVEKQKSYISLNLNGKITSIERLENEQ